MQVELNELLRGKATKIKDKQFYPTAAYVEPFLERMQKYTNEFVYNVKLPDQITTFDNTDDITYNRVWVQAILPEEINFPNHKESIHLLYSLDGRKPLYKIARSAINGACLNQCVFNPSFIQVNELCPESFINYSGLNLLLELSSDISMWLNKLQQIEVSYEEQIINENLGKWVRQCLEYSYNSGFGKVKLATSVALDAYKLLYTDPHSDYYIKEGESTSLFNIYNAFTDIISHNDKDIVNPLEKTLLLKNILDFA